VVTVVAVEVIAGGGGEAGAQAPITAADTIKTRMVVGFTAVRIP
jgi:hypothetical protein